MSDACLGWMRAEGRLLLCAVRAALVHGTHQAVDTVLRRWKKLQAATPDESIGSIDDESSKLALSDDNVLAAALLCWIEDCLFHGLKVSGARQAFALHHTRQSVYQFVYRNRRTVLRLVGTF